MAFIQTDLARINSGLYHVWVVEVVGDTNPTLQLVHPSDSVTAVDGKPTHLLSELCSGLPDGLRTGTCAPAPNEQMVIPSDYMTRKG